MSTASRHCEVVDGVEKDVKRRSCRRLVSFPLVLITMIALCHTPFSALAAGNQGTTVDPVILGAMQFPSAAGCGPLAYLGVSTDQSVRLSQIKAERLIIVILNSFCTICQADAPMLNWIYKIIEDDPVLKGKVKLVGIAPGNNQTEVEHFRKEHEVPFPVFPDPDFSLDRAIPKNLRTPMLVAVKITEEKRLQVVKTHHGAIKSVDDVLEKPVRSTMADPEVKAAQGM